MRGLWYLTQGERPKIVAQLGAQNLLGRQVAKSGGGGSRRLSVEIVWGDLDGQIDR